MYNNINSLDIADSLKAKEKFLTDTVFLFCILQKIKNIATGMF
jgi:hypothetical protein